MLHKPPPLPPHQTSPLHQPSQLSGFLAYCLLSYFSPRFSFLLLLLRPSFFHPPPPHMPFPSSHVTSSHMFPKVTTTRNITHTRTKNIPKKKRNSPPHCSPFFSLFPSSLLVRLLRGCAGVGEGGGGALSNHYFPNVVCSLSRQKKKDNNLGRGSFPSERGRRKKKKKKKQRKKYKQTKKKIKEKKQT